MPSPATTTPIPTPTAETPTAAPGTDTPAPNSSPTHTAAGTPVVLTAAIVAGDTSSVAAATHPAALCVGILPRQPSLERGQAAQWTVGAWAQGGNIPDATIKLKVTPSGGGTAAFTIGCAAGNGTSSCHLGAVDATSTQRQFQAQVTVPLTAATVTSVTLTVTGNAAGLRTAPRASASIPVLAPPAPAGAMPSLPVGDIPDITAPTPTLSPGGNAAGLFPTLNPSPAAPGPGSAGPKGTRQVADASAFSGTSNQADAEVAGLAALALAFILAFTRVSIRRPAASATGTSAPSEPATKTLEQPGKPGETPKAPSA